MTEDAIDMQFDAIAKELEQPVTGNQLGRLFEVSKNVRGLGSEVRDRLATLRRRETDAVRKLNETSESLIKVQAQLRDTQRRLRAAHHDLLIAEVRHRLARSADSLVSNDVVLTRQQVQALLDALAAKQGEDDGPGKGE